MKNFLHVQVPFFIPLWRRIVVTVAVIGWAVFELSMNEPSWALLFGAVGLYLAHQFFIAWKPESGGDDSNDDGA